MSFSTQPSTYHPLPNVKELLCVAVPHSYKWTQWFVRWITGWIQRLDCGVRRLKGNCSVWAHPAGHRQTSHGYSAAGGLISHPSFRFSQEATAQYLLAALCIFLKVQTERALLSFVWFDGDNERITTYGVCPQEVLFGRLVSVLVWVFVLVWYGLFGFGSKKAEKNKAMLFSSHQSPASHPQFSVPVFRGTEHFVPLSTFTPTFFWLLSSLPQTFNQEPEAFQENVEDEKSWSFSNTCWPRLFVTCKYVWKYLRIHFKFHICNY